jgi:hypothetical protein
MYLCGAAEALLEITRGLDPDEHMLHEQTLHTLRARLDPGTLAARWAEGRALNWEQAVEEALHYSEAAPAAFAVSPALPPPPANLPMPLIGREVYKRLAPQPMLGEAMILVGRAQEWAQLQAAWRAAADGRP